MKFDIGWDSKELLSKERMMIVELEDYELDELADCVS